MFEMKELNVGLCMNAYVQDKFTKKKGGADDEFVMQRRKCAVLCTVRKNKKIKIEHPRQNIGVDIYRRKIRRFSARMRMDMLTVSPDVRYCVGTSDLGSFPGRV